MPELMTSWKDFMIKAVSLKMIKQNLIIHSRMATLGNGEVNVRIKMIKLFITFVLQTLSTLEQKRKPNLYYIFWIRKLVIVNFSTE